MVAGQRYAAADGGGGGGSAVENGKGRTWYFGFISSFMLATGWGSQERKTLEGGRRDRKTGGRGWVERGTLNYNPLRDTAEFAFKIKRA